MELTTEGAVGSAKLMMSKNPATALVVNNLWEAASCTTISQVLLLLPEGSKLPM